MLSIKTCLKNTSLISYEVEGNLSMGMVETRFLTKNIQLFFFYKLAHFVSPPTLIN